MNACKFLPLLLIISAGISARAQVSKENTAYFIKAEDTLKQYASRMIFENKATDRFVADSAFIRTLVRTLKKPYSFGFPFDSLKTVSRLYAPDSSFRIFTWQFMKDETYYRQRGAIQIKTADGSLKLFPLIDMSEFTPSPVDSVRTNLNWMGAIYYGMVMKTWNNKKYYTLLGYDDNNFRSTRKWIEVLSFTEQGLPQFGGKFFIYPEDTIKPKQPAYRFLLEYKKDARARITYDKDMDLIIFDHLISETKDPGKKYTLIPDGDQEGFKWQNGKWVYVEKVFNYKLEDGQFPMEVPIKDASGKSNEAWLLEQSKKNMEKAGQNKPQTKKPPVNKPMPQEEY